LKLFFLLGDLLRFSSSPESRRSGARQPALLIGRGPSLRRYAFTQASFLPFWVDDLPFPFRLGGFAHVAFGPFFKSLDSFFP